MFRGIYTATNSMRTNAKRLDTITNNIANSTTTGYKKDEMVVESFPEKLMVKLGGNEGVLRATRQVVTVTPPANEQGGSPVTIDVTRGYITMEDAQGKGYYQSVRVSRDQEGYLRTITRDSDSNIHQKFGSYLLDNRGNRVQVNEGAIEMDGSGVLKVGGQAVANVLLSPEKRVIGTVSGGSWVDRTMINFNQGALEYTENPLNIALEGKGFIKILDLKDNQEKYTRQGAMTISTDGFLTDHLGNPILSTSGSEISIPNDAGKMNIDPSGNIYDKDNLLIDNIRIVGIANPEDMKKAGESYLVANDGAELEETDFEGRVLQGYLEGSNVDTIREMVDMISVMRSFEADQKVIRSYDDIMAKAANEIGKM